MMDILGNDKSIPGEGEGKEKDLLLFSLWADLTEFQVLEIQLSPCPIIILIDVSLRNLKF